MNFQKLNDFDKCSAIIKMSFFDLHSKLFQTQFFLFILLRLLSPSLVFREFWWQEDWGSINNFFKNVSTWVFVLLSDFSYFSFFSQVRNEQIFFPFNFSEAHKLTTNKWNVIQNIHSWVSPWWVIRGHFSSKISSRFLELSVSSFPLGRSGTWMNEYVYNCDE